MREGLALGRGDERDSLHSFGSVALPDGFHHAAAEIFSRAPRVSEAEADATTLDRVLIAMTKPAP